MFCWTARSAAGRIARQREYENPHEAQFPGGAVKEAFNLNVHITALADYSLKQMACGDVFPGRGPSLYTFAATVNLMR